MKKSTLLFLSTFTFFNHTYTADNPFNSSKKDRPNCCIADLNNIQGNKAINLILITQLHLQRRRGTSRHTPKALFRKSTQPAEIEIRNILQTGEVIPSPQNVHLACSLGNPTLIILLRGALPKN